MCRFLPAPSVRRATGCITSCAGCWGNFYPRPPRGGRPRMPYLAAVCASISIHALREEGDFGRGGGKQSMADFYPRPPRGGRLIYCKRLNPDTCISIHALREEGDPSGTESKARSSKFLSTPSARRATSTAPPSVSNTMYFYPRPPRGGRHAGHRCRPED